MTKLKIIGGGLAGTEAAWQGAMHGVEVELYEMRPQKMTPAHKTGGLGELVCSNSLRGDALENAVGLLKEEMRHLNSLIMEAAQAARVPAGGALAVDRAIFSQYLEDKITGHPNITLIRQEVTEIPEVPAIIAAGPLASEAISNGVKALTGEDNLFFHDAVAPIVAFESIDMNKAFFASRYDKGDGKDYLNCPMNKEEYLAFHQALRDAQLQPLHGFEEEKTFEGCMPIETMAKRGEDTMRYGPLKPVGLDLPDGSQAYAVVQLRQDDAAANMYNLVGFQTRLKWGEQERVFRMIPGLENAEFLRFGVMHRNTYLNSPRLLQADLQLKSHPGLFFAGQITGVEGYVESAACGLAAGINGARLIKNEGTLTFPLETALGSLLNYISTPAGNFQPMNITFGLVPPLGYKERKKRLKNAALAKRALESLDNFIKEYKLNQHT